MDNKAVQNQPEKIQPKDIYESLWRCRDFELSHLWQRSVFLTAFLLLAYTGYGVLMLHIMTVELGMLQLRVLLCVGLFILLVGMLLSLLWIMMAKGSKAWYEVYEHAIYEIEHNPDYASEIVVDKMSEDGRMPMSVTLPVNPPISTMSPTLNSPSKINIVIGQLSYAIFLSVYLAQTILMACVDAYMIRDSITTIISLLIPLILIHCYVCHELKYRVHSSYLDKGYDKSPCYCLFL